jgi:unsaturated rhamnogalacturonyl hydrolase
VYNLVKRKDYREYINKTAIHIMQKQDRLPDGTLVRKSPHEMTLWADDLFMSVPFLARIGNLTGEEKYFSDALKQVFNFNKYLWNPDKELYYHCYYSDLERNGVAHWGRCNGWIMMAQVHLMNFLPEDHPQREELRKTLEQQILGIAKYQNGDGLWHQVLDKTDSYLESSCSAMFVYSIARAVNEGWIDRRYASIALRGWEGLKENKITLDGQLKDICVGTGIEDNIVFYYNRPARTNETHGLGAIIDAGIEVIKLRKSMER